MAVDQSSKKNDGGSAQPQASTPAERALAEAEARRKAATPPRNASKEVGRDGPEPTRYGDWEKGGIASDF